MKIGPGEHDWLTLAECFSNVFISGRVGSSKTTAVGAWLATGLLAHDARPGGLVLCQKPDEASRWLRYAAQTGRAADVIHVRPGGPHKIDVVNYTLSVKGGGADVAQQDLEIIMELANRNKTRTSGDSYWPESSGRQMRVPMVLIPMTGRVCGLEQILRFCQSLPDHPDRLKDAAWVSKSYAMNVTFAASEQHEHERAFDMAAAFVCESWPSLAEKTRSIIQSVTENTLERLLSGPFADLISSGETTFTPEQALDDGKVIVFDVPGTVYGPPAQWASVAVKLLFQRAVLRRDLSRECRPVFLWADEAGNYCVPRMDALFLSQARQFQCACVNIAQNYPLIYTALGGGETAKQESHAWLSNHAIHFVSAQSDYETCTYYSNLFGEERELLYGGSSGGEPYDLVGDAMGTWHSTAQANWSQQYRPSVPPDRFARLATGGEAYDYVAEAYVFASGRQFSSGRTWIKSSFRQRL